MDSVSPPAADFGRTSVGIYTGSVNQQTLFLDLGTVADPTSVLQLDAERIPGEPVATGQEARAAASEMKGPKLRCLRIACHA